ncbi:MAG: methyltransferase domain-containing protein [Bryobacterales bacterium]|nr:methyltransferase domain-containing protein [Bryobacterales bacterium]
MGPSEEDQIFEYLNLLVSRPEVRRALGENARRYVERECNWDLVATRYADFLKALHEGRPWPEPRPDAAPAIDGAMPESGRAHEQAIAPFGIEPPVPARAPEPEPEAVIEPEYIAGWAENPESRTYIETHTTRLVRTLEITPRGTALDRVLEMGAYLQITPALKTKLGYGEVRGCYYGEPGRVDRRSIVSADGETFECEIDHFNAEKDSFPYPDGHFATVLCCELIEHLFEDPMHLMSEINRILKPGGHLVLTTPNVISNRAISAILQGYHPGFFHAYIRPPKPGKEVEARHNREYSPREVHRLLENSGFVVALLETGEFRDEPHPEHGWVYHLLDRYSLSTDLRGDGIYAVGEKTGGVRERYPGWLYT